jgi:hypothetical protein
MLELGDRITEIFPNLKIHPDIVKSIAGVLQGELLSGLDFPHQPHHSLRVYRDAQCIAGSKVKEWEKEFLLMGSVVHDLGRNFVEMGVIDENQHQDASFVLTKTIAMIQWGYSNEVASYFAEGIALHTEDVLPAKTHRWIRILRDADRTARTGMGAVLEIAWWLGYRDDYIEKTPLNKMVDDELLFDLSIPTEMEEYEQYDRKPRQYVNNNVLPWLRQHQKLDELVSGMNVFIDRIYGVPNEAGKKRRWKVEPVSEKAQFLVKPRIESMKSFLIKIGYPPRNT